MKNAQFTRQERFMIVWLQFLLFFFLLTTFLLIFLPYTFFGYLNNIGLVFFNFSSPRLTVLPFDIWQVLTTSLMVILIVVTFQAQREWLRYFPFVSIILMAKGICLVGLLALIFLTPPHFFYILGAVVEGVLFVVTAYSYAKAIRSRNF